MSDHEPAALAGSVYGDERARPGPWHDDPATEKQRTTLRKLGVRIPAKGLTKLAASNAITHALAARHPQRCRCPLC